MAQVLADMRVGPRDTEAAEVVDASLGCVVWRLKCNSAARVAASNRQRERSEQQQWMATSVGSRYQHLFALT
jgi:hypothetical protein